MSIPALSHSAKLPFLLLCLLALAGCGATGADYVPVVDGPQDARFHNDLAQCQQVAEQRGYMNGDTLTDTLIGAGVGALIGGLTGDWAGAGIGAGVGGLVGGGSTAYDAKDERKSIVTQCMRNRGHNVVG